MYTFPVFYCCFYRFAKWSDDSSYSRALSSCKENETYVPRIVLSQLLDILIIVTHILVVGIIITIISFIENVTFTITILIYYCFLFQLSVVKLKQK